MYFNQQHSALEVCFARAVWNQWNGTVEWNTGMEFLFYVQMYKQLPKRLGKVNIHILTLNAYLYP